MVLEVLVEEVRAVLTTESGNGVHVGGVHAISEELEGRAWEEVPDLILTVLESERVPYDSILVTLEDTGVRLARLGHPPYLLNHADRVNGPPSWQRPQRPPSLLQEVGPLERQVEVVEKDAQRFHRIEPPRVRIITFLDLGPNGLDFLLSSPRLF